MTKRLIAGSWILLLTGAFLISVSPGIATPASGITTPNVEKILGAPGVEKILESGDKTTNAAVFHPISPGPADGRIAFITATMLETHQYLRQKFDDTISAKLLDRYLEALDPQHVHFLQSDLDEFERYRTTLDDLTRNSDAKPACQIFNRFMERLQQRVAYAGDVLKTEHFQFDTDERIM